MKKPSNIMSDAGDALAMIHEVGRKKNCRFYLKWAPIAPLLGKLRFLGKNRTSLGFLPFEGETTEQTLERVFAIRKDKREMFEKAFRQIVSGDGKELENMLTLRSSALYCLLHFYDKAGGIMLFNIPYGNGVLLLHVESVSFEVKNNVFGGLPSNVDALLEGNDEEGKKVSLYLESKMTEYFDLVLEETYSASYYPYFQKWLKGMPGLEILLEGEGEEQKTRLRSDRPRYLEGLKQMCAHLIGIAKKEHSPDEIVHLGEVVLPFEGKELGAYREDYRILARNMNASFEETKVHVLPDLFFYGKYDQANDPKVTIFYGEYGMPRVGAFYFINGRIMREWEPFVPEEGNPFVNGRIGHSELYRMIQLEGLMDALEHDDYSYWPRGRVIFDLAGGKSLVYMDPCLLSDERAKDAVREEFRLSEDAIFLEDEHYRCHKCSEEIARLDREED